MAILTVATVAASPSTVMVVKAAMVLVSQTCQPCLLLPQVVHAVLIVVVVAVAVWEVLVVTTVISV